MTPGEAPPLSPQAEAARAGTPAGHPREAVPRDTVPREAVPREAVPREAVPREAVPCAPPALSVPRRVLGVRQVPVRVAARLGITAFLLFLLGVGPAWLDTVDSAGEGWSGGDPSPRRLLGLALAVGALVVLTRRPRIAAVMAGTAALSYPIAAGLTDLGLRPEWGALPVSAWIAGVLCCHAVTRLDRRAGLALAGVLALSTLLTGTVSTVVVIPSWQALPLHPWSPVLLGAALVPVVMWGIAVRLRPWRADPWSGEPVLLGRRPGLTNVETVGVVAVVAFVLATTLPHLVTESLPRLSWGGWIGARVLLVVLLSCLSVAATAATPWFPRAGAGCVLICQGLLGGMWGSHGAEQAEISTILLATTVYAVTRQALVRGVVIGGGLSATILVLLMSRPDMVGDLPWGYEYDPPYTLAELPAQVFLFATGNLTDLVLALYAEDVLGLTLPLVAMGTALYLTSWLAAAGQRSRAREAGLLAESRAALAAERSRLARELHDVVAHHVSLVAVRAETAPYTAPGLSTEAAEAFAEIAEDSRRALTELRTILGVLRREDGTAPELAPLPGAPELPALVEQVRRCGVRVDAELPADLSRLDGAVGLVVYRVVQESLSNAVRHAPGAAVEVRVAFGTDLRVTVTNTPATGTGTPPDRPSGTAAPGTAAPGTAAPGTAAPGTAAPGRPALGLIGMRERVTCLGGALDAGPTPDGGFRVDARLPFEGAE